MENTVAGYRYYRIRQGRYNGIEIDNFAIARTESVFTRTAFSLLHSVTFTSRGNSRLSIWQNFVANCKFLTQFFEILASSFCTLIFDLEIFHRLQFLFSTLIFVPISVSPTPTGNPFTAFYANNLSSKTKTFTSHAGLPGIVRLN